MGVYRRNSDYIASNMAFNSAMDSLQHYGVAGMKWGVRNDETLRKYGLKKYGGMSAEKLAKKRNALDRKMTKVDAKIETHSAKIQKRSMKNYDLKERKYRKKEKRLREKERRMDKKIQRYERRHSPDDDYAADKLDSLRDKADRYTAKMDKVARANGKDFMKQYKSLLDSNVKTIQRYKQVNDKYGET